MWTYSLEIQISKNDKIIGNFKIREIWKNNKQYIYISEANIEPQYRKLGNFMFLRNYFKNRFPRANFVYFWNNRRNKFVYMR